MAVVIGVAVAVVLFAAVVAGARVRGSGPEPLRRSVTVRTAGDRAVVTVELAGVDGHDPAVARLIDEAAQRTFAVLRDAAEVEVQDRDGMTLAVRARSHPIPPAPVELPPELLEPHRRPATLPPVAEDDRPDLAHPHYAPGRDRPARPLAERFELPAAAIERVRDRDDPAAIVAAILEASGRNVVAEHGGEVLRAGDDVVIVVRTALGAPVTAPMLSHAYRRFEETRARRGVVVTPGHLDRHDVHRREALAPQLLHAGPDGIQRMADALAAGADPMRFVVPLQLAVVR